MSICRSIPNMYAYIRSPTTKSKKPVNMRRASNDCNHCSVFTAGSIQKAANIYNSCLPMLAKLTLYCHMTT